MLNIRGKDYNGMEENIKLIVKLEQPKQAEKEADQEGLVNVL